MWFNLGMDRFVLTDAQWAKMEPHCLGREGGSGRNGADNRLFLEAVLWVVRTGRSWRDLPPVFGKWKSAYVRFRYWGKAGVFQRLFAAASEDPEMEYAMVDGVLVKLDRDGEVAQKGLKIRLSARLNDAGFRQL